ncbi:uncharacterized protein C8orf34 homolog isoform X2 [Strongylocentrotus purpuratus]|uniref:Uncharacterized protein n=1 Tax=Strongylocentrotus purpuratus TaxID=7668 RepID=A0A7M7STC9_STRPU|nr:uncharacterized protein C8orf34 homolog isoform X2 [Strongylocentrotus purpuratus]
MAGPQKVQNYLDRHRISALFEDLMARLIKNTPQEPVPYLIKILQKFDEKSKKPFQENPLAPKTKPLTPGLSKTQRIQSKNPLTKSTSSLRKDPLSKSTGQLSRSTSNLAKEPSGAKGGSPSSPGYAWQPGNATGKFGVDRGYERPWIANMRKIKYEQAQLKARKLHKSSSTADDAEGSIKSTLSSEADSMDVDQIFEMSQEKPPVRPKTLFSNPASQAWVDMDPQPYQPPPPKPYQPPDQVEEAFLKEELSADKLMKQYEKESSKNDSAASDKQKVEQRRAKPDQKAKKHKEELAALVEAQRKVETLGYLDSGGETGDPDQGGYEEATDVLEDASDLMDEGVANVKSTGKKVRRRPPPAPQVKVGVCSRCANVQGGGDGGSTVAGFAQGYGAYASIDSSSEVSHSSSSDFESASQVSGPRPMAWEGTTDDVKSTRPGTTRSMTHDQASELFHQSSSQYRSGGAEGSSSYRVESSREVRSSQRWETSSHTSEVERRLTGTESLLERGRSWAQPGSDDDSSV